MISREKDSGFGWKLKDCMKYVFIFFEFSDFFRLSTNGKMQREIQNPQISRQILSPFPEKSSLHKLELTDWLR
jgi:ABC-type uncharacterized transport system permease subunit